MDTIFALASAPGKAGVAVLRVSGPDAVSGVGRLVRDLPERGLRTVRDFDDEPVDQALVLTFPKGHSFTGEEVVELHLHGSPAITGRVLHLLSDLPGLRQAEAGEFTRRALENGRLDLAQVEGLADLIEAETEAQRRQAMRVLSGALGDKAESWRTRLIRAAALIEATIDFADEEVPVDVSPEVLDLIGAVQAEMRAESAGVAAAERVRAGFEVAIVGAPNVGKSTLLNRLAGREAAITSEIAGTTRDVIEVKMDLRGLPVTFLDTAGLRASDDVVEKIGIDRGLERARLADLRIYMLVDGDQPLLDLVDGDIAIQARADERNLADGLSAKTGQGVERLIDQVTETLSGRVANIGIAMRERHRMAMNRAAEHLESAENQIRSGSEMADLVAEDLRSAVRAVESLVGRVDVEDLLDEIFSSFCIGK
ncbi:tRNA uridine-5-carboxymethylaminomethyl(34) synthesis GTPase MnmE [Loktanella sp. IMCC34160]|uniref:tRNA uridine-5-carboxymethylaminomethyl(34) synthesis GTPase MnmE n=1 Tax=Loktanella sp. IMCC34160 TaxID=2510646 RepID=UPI00101C8224|nr:tRNA uridine-5-carboxymethylaminomethyl(34) synthesis GTPase MnmE [Loktanella sp. IMCC34160]RYG91326.1 tRNA uridine-5-carboxymethylaminomethyl(34) synthesis GTPase MnmE [Loktanella sp. IMCC34160]